MRLVNIRPSRGPRILIGAVPIAIAIVIYMVFSAARSEANPNDKVLPTFLAMAQAAWRLFTQVDPRTGEITALADTTASLWRLGIGVGIATLSTLIIGIALGVVPLVRAALGPIVTIIAVIPPIAVLPILFIVMGLGESSKIALIFVGLTPFMVRDLASAVAAIPEEQLVKAQTLGANTWIVALRIALPQALPRLLESLRFSLGPAWVFLISAEAIAADVGLGYRIFLVRRYLAMDVILPYVAWISLLAVVMDWALQALSRAAFPWAHPKRSR